MNLALIFIIGAFGYGALETIWRGFTHWTMMLCGGIAFCAMYLMYIHSNGIPVAVLSLISSLFITSIELLAGYILNIKLKMNIWDYTNMPFNYKGQICLPYTVLWFLLSAGIFKMYTYFPLK